MKRETFQTTNLILRRSSQERDGEIFFQMLQETGNDDFRMFTGVDCYGSFLYNFEEILRLLRMWYSFVERSSRKGCFYFLLAVAEVQEVAWW